MNMKEYRLRIYRNRFNSKRWRLFTVNFKESDLCIGVAPSSYTPEMETFAAATLKRLRTEMESYLAKDPAYGITLSPYTPAGDAPDILVGMAEAAAEAGIGPMGAVAGAVAEYIGSRIREMYSCREVVVENGGDIYADVAAGIEIPVFAGSSPLSQRVGIFIPDGGQFGICTSSGTVGPSLSLGSADAVMTVCGNAALADSYATAFANRIRSKSDVAKVIDRIKAVPAISGAICIKEDMFGICGQYGLKIWKRECLRR